MTVLSGLDAAGRRRSPATMPGYHAGRPPHNKGMRYPADPLTIDEIVAGAHVGRGVAARQPTTSPLELARAAVSRAEIDETGLGGFRLSIGAGMPTGRGGCGSRCAAPANRLPAARSSG
jgi:hypothetical protein